MNHPGEIGRLAAIAAPTIALVNNAQREHQEFMHTVDAVARENGSVFDALPPDGIAVFPGDDRFTPLWRAQGAGRRTITFGLDGACDVHCRYQASGFGSDLTVAANGTMSEISVAVAGVHNVRNALAAFGCALAVGVERRVIVRGLELFVPVSGRLQKKLGARGTTVIDDSYNANPDSVRAAIDVLAQAAAPRILVLGDMGEVGEQGREFHAEIGAYALERGIDTVLATGELARHLGAATQHFEQLEALQTALDARLANAPHATVLVKGSRFMKMERVVAHLLGPDHLQPEAH